MPGLLDGLPHLLFAVATFRASGPLLTRFDNNHVRNLRHNTDNKSPVIALFGRNIPTSSNEEIMTLNANDIKVVRYNSGLHLGAQGKLF